MSKNVQIFMVLALYMIARLIVYQFVPVSDFASWLMRDLYMSIPRGIGIIAVIIILSGKIVWKNILFGDKPKSLWILIKYVCFIFLFEFFIRRFNFDIDASLPSIFIILVTTLLVAVFEELLFTAGVFEIFKKKFGGNLLYSLNRWYVYGIPCPGSAAVDFSLSLPL